MEDESIQPQNRINSRGFSFLEMLNGMTSGDPVDRNEGKEDLRYCVVKLEHLMAIEEMFG